MEKNVDTLYREQVNSTNTHFDLEREKTYTQAIELHERFHNLEKELNEVINQINDQNQIESQSVYY